MGSLVFFVLQVLSCHFFSSPSEAGKKDFSFPSEAETGSLQDFTIVDLTCRTYTQYYLDGVVIAIFSSRLLPPKLRRKIQKFPPKIHFSDPVRIRTCLSTMVEKKLTFLMLGRVLALTFAYLLPSASGASKIAPFGQEARCPNGDPISGVCTSGREAGCQGGGTAVNCGGYKLLDSTYASDTDSEGRDMIGYGPGEWSYCPDDAVATGVCSSGEDDDCHWSQAYTRLWCSRIDTAKMSFVGTATFTGCQANQMCSCDPGQVIVGFAASGKDKNVVWFNGDTINYGYTGLLCRPLVCNAGGKNY